ncbi:Cytochrome P450 [Glarea lozoyensis ATCC 20868]|uniref:Cytochrome P450 n=1 Tax=Glarea lozoyensis (strain ATCC 20868 / MF5171) TaxID=1116229 RepID=S3CP44_GLAL2|nr:Cytochrome P450 [Glarea lozoyensis ATCC 20868]EPE27485.1 Cytochrome P450 [Glarea lozoyensis ATCC 20868]
MEFSIFHIPILAFLAYSLQKLCVAYFHPLSNVPNAHFTTPLSRAWLLVQKYRGCENHARHAAHKRLGPIIRLGPHELSINSIEGVQTVYNNSSFERTEWFLNAFRGREAPFMVCMLRTKEHGSRKRMMASIYMKTYIQNSPVIKSLVIDVFQKSFRNELAKWAVDALTVDVMQAFQPCVTDFTTGWLFGIKARTDWLHNKSEANTFYRNFERSGADDAQQNLRQWSNEMCQKSLKTADAKNDICQDGGATHKASVCSELHTHLRKTENPEATATFLKDEMLDHVIANQIATAIVLTYVTYSLSLNPLWQTKLRSELNNLSTPQNEKFPSPRDLDSLPILDAIITETLRLYSPNPGPWPRHHPTSSCQINGGYTIPARTTISASSYTLHRNDSVFPDPEEWKPERWLEASTEQRAGMMKWFWAFGSGTRMCIGSNLALLSLKAVVKVIYSEFETEIVDGSGMEQMDSVIAGPVGDKLLLKFVKVK